MKKIKLCFICTKQILERYKLTALEVPYINLFSHPECITNLNTDELLVYIKKWLKVT